MKQTDSDCVAAIGEPAVDAARERSVAQGLLRLRSESRWYLWRVVGSLGSATLAFACFVLALNTEALHAPNVALLLCCVLCMMLGGLLIPHSNSKSLEILAQSPDVRMIGPLLEALPVAPEAKSQQIHALLTLLLPRLLSADAVLLTKRQRRVLYDALRLSDADQGLDYLLAALQAVMQIGDREALYFLRHIVQRGAITPGQQTLQYAACECLRVVEARQAHQHIHDSLLRPSAPEEPSTELLRAAHAAPESAPQTLLRPR